MIEIDIMKMREAQMVYHDSRYVVRHHTAERLKKRRVRRGAPGLCKPPARLLSPLTTDAERTL